MTAAPGLAAWLRDAVTERLELARKATQAPWEAEGDDPTDDEVWIDIEGEPWRVIILRGPDSHENMLHVAANDPQDTIARCEAELAILDEHASDGDRIDPECAGCAARHPASCECGWQSGGGQHWRTAAPWPCRTVRLLGSGYRHRDGYLEEWAPSPGTASAGA